ncbi:hypothetical protein [Algoriphagus yeomjeoni]|uniref:Lipoprotein n=1 Tax=Algoriphagus yeomjeoni TaxID=291403 RepID=A0A327PR41_9BACT|nr:hypothetical protein [Algoriphagus yeomjeoni]RAI93794.1 hypothetical protein LV83_00700 [Algoriphagus yeomjeoni]
MKYYLALPVLLLLFLQSCQEDNVPIGWIEFYWDQTGCADPWNTNSNTSNAETENAIEDYLKVEGVKRAKVLSITGDGVVQGCYACFCTTGKRFNVAVPKDQKSKMLDLGFKESS